MTSSYHNEIGKLLQNAREDLQLNLQQASTALHIRAHYLHALEIGDLTNLPGAAYTKGYLQAYAVFLHLDKDELLRRFELIENNLPENGLFFPQVFSKEKKPSHSVILLGLALVLIAYVLWFLLFKPDLVALSVVAMPSYKMEVTTSFPVANYTPNLTCAAPQVRLYPPCYSAAMGRMSEIPALPLRRQRNSIMELAD